MYFCVIESILFGNDQQKGVSPALIFVQKAFLLGLFSEGLVIGRNFAFKMGLASQ